MTEAATAAAPAVTASDLLSNNAAPAAPATAPKYQPVGFPVVPAAFDAPPAAAARAEIKEKIVDKEFYKSLIAERERGVTGPASQAWSELHARGWPSPPAVGSQADVDNQAKGRNAEMWNPTLLICERASLSRLSRRPKSARVSLMKNLTNGPLRKRAA